MTSFSRRRFLKALGVSAVGAHLLPLLPRNIWAQDAPAPKRFVGFFTPNGTVLPDFQGSGTGAGFDLGYALAPLQERRSEILVLRGLDMNVVREGPGGGHQKGAGAFLTGQPLLQGDFCGGNNCSTQSGWPAGVSADQEIARAVGEQNRFASLELGVKVLGSNNRHRIAFRGANDPLPPLDDPQQVYDRLFSSVAQNQSQLERLRREQGSVLDLVGADLAELQARLGREHLQRLEAHTESLRDVEMRLDSFVEDCMAPAAHDPFDHRANSNFPLAGQLQLDMIASSFACDLTRVATVLWSGATSNQPFPWIGINESHHSLSHEGDSNADAQQKLADINRWYAEQFDYLLQQLAAMPEGDGTVLDNTVVLWGSDLALGNRHSHSDMRFVLAGGGGAFRTGERLVINDRHHNDLLVTIMQWFGIEQDRFGHQDYSAGALSQIMA